MKIKIYLILLVTLCLQACDKNDPLEIENPEIETETETETETPHELEGVWELADFSGVMSETKFNIKFDYIISLDDPKERAISIEQDSFCYTGRYELQILTFENGDTTVIGSISYGSNDPNEYSICRFSNYTTFNDTIISEGIDPIGLFFPAPNTNFGYDKDDGQTSKYIIEDGILTITTSDVDNETTNDEDNEIKYTFISTWMKT